MIGTSFKRSTLITYLDDWRSMVLYLRWIAFTRNGKINGLSITECWMDEAETISEDQP